MSEVNDFTALDTVLTQFDKPAETKPVEPAPVTEPVTPAAEPEPAEPAKEPETPAATPEPEQTPEQILSGSKQNAAFAQMRVQNKQMQETITKLGGLLGLEVADHTQLITALEQKMLQFQAQETNIPVNVLQELEASRKAQQQQEAETHRTNALLGFQKVKDTFSLDQKGLNEFANQLNEAGKNPFTDPLDLIQEYRMLNFERILQQERDKAAQEVIARQKKAEAHSTTPAKAVGAPPTSATPVTTVSGLEELLRGGGF